MNVYEIVTSEIIKKLEAGDAPWRKPWNTAVNHPRNLVSGHRYSGINVLLLVSTGYRSPYWLTFKQAKDKGGEVRKGEKSTLVVFYKRHSVKAEDASGNPVYDDNGNQAYKTIPLLRYYRVFNVEQTTLDVPEIPVPETDVSPIEAADEIVDGFKDKPEYREGGPRAYYEPFMDRITLPPRETFDSTEEYYSTLFHELGHSTGHESRTNRHGRKHFAFGNHDYGREELVAEMTATFLAAEAGIEVTQDNSAAYLRAWISKLQEDSRAVVVAAGAAQKAADYILGRVAEENDEE